MPWRRVEQGRGPRRSWRTTWAAWASRVTEGNRDEGVIRLVGVRVEGTAVLVAEGEVAVWPGAHPHSIPVPGDRAILAEGAQLPPPHTCWTHTNHYTHFTDGKPSLALKVTQEVRKLRRMWSPLPVTGQNSFGAGGQRGLISFLWTHRRICILRGYADSPAGTGAKGFLEAAAFCTGTSPGSQRMQAAEGSGRTPWTWAPRQVQMAPGSLSPPCPAGAPQSRHIPHRPSCSPPQTAA